MICREELVFVTTLGNQFRSFVEKGNITGSQDTEFLTKAYVAA